MKKDYWAEPWNLTTGRTIRQSRNRDVPMLPLGEEMARPIATLIREGDLIRNSKMLTEAQKNHALTMLRKEIDEATGQGTLPIEPESGGVPPAPQSTPAAGKRP